MGNCAESACSSFQKITFECQECNDVIAQQKVSSHKCWEIKEYRPDLKIEQENYFPTQTPTGETIITSPSMKVKVLFPLRKVPLDSSHTKFRWKQVQKLVIIPSTIQLSPANIEKKSFQEKKQWFDEKLQNKRLSDRKQFLIKKSDLFQSTRIALEKVNIYSTFDIKYIDSKNNESLENFIYLMTERIFSSDFGIFERCVTDESAYKFISYQKKDLQKIQQQLQIYGKIVGKAILENIELKKQLNRTILRMLMKKKIKLCDIYSYNKNYYQQWKNMIENPQITSKKDLFYKKGQKQRKVTPENVQKCIARKIRDLCFISVKGQLQSFLRGVYFVIPPKLLKVFQPYQLQMIIYGENDESWKANVRYKGFKPKDKTIREFWKIMEAYNKEKTKKLFYLWTGSEEYPIENGPLTIQKATNEKITGSKNLKILYLPAFEKESEMKKKLEDAIKN